MGNNCCSIILESIRLCLNNASLYIVLAFILRINDCELFGILGKCLLMQYDYCVTIGCLELLSYYSGYILSGLKEHDSLSI